MRPDAEDSTITGNYHQPAYCMLDLFPTTPYSFLGHM
jgi:hypothetical protein